MILYNQKRPKMTIKTNEARATPAFSMIAASLIADFNMQYFNVETKTEVAKIFHNLKEHSFFAVDCFEHSHLERIENQPTNYQLVGSFFAHPNPCFKSENVDAEFLMMLASETSTMLKKYIKKFNVDLNLTTYLEKENLGYYQADLQAMLQLFKEEIDNIETRVFKHFNYLLSKKDLQNDIKTFIVFKELDNHIKNFNLKFFCFRMRSMLSNDSAIKVEFANAIQNYILGKI